METKFELFTRDGYSPANALKKLLEEIEQFKEKNQIKVISLSHSVSDLRKKRLDTETNLIEYETTTWDATGILAYEEIELAIKSDNDGD